VADASNLAVNESKTVTVRANEPSNDSNIYLSKGQKYKFTVGSPAWNNGSKETDAGGYTCSGDYLCETRRHPDYKLMALVGEIHAPKTIAHPWDMGVIYTGYKFLIGLGRATYTVPVSGWLVTFANDCLACYVDNSRVVTLTVTRIE